MGRRAAVSSFDVALGLVWLVIIFSGIIYIVTRVPNASVPIVEPQPLFQDRMETLRSLNTETTLTVEERVELLSALKSTELTDDRPSVYPGSSPTPSVEERLNLLESLKYAQ